MKHISSIKKLSRKRDQRKALLKTQAESLILKERIKTTETKAKVLKPFVEKLMTQAKKQNLPSLRVLKQSLSSQAVAKIRLLARQRYQGRQGGYLRIVKLPSRVHDSAKMAIISFVE